MTKTISLTVETYQKVENYFSFCEDYTFYMNEFLPGCSGDQMISNASDYPFNKWFSEKWELGLYEDWEEPVPEPWTLNEFFESLHSTYKLCLTWKYIENTNKIKFSISRKIDSRFEPEYEPVKVRASGA